MAELKDPAEKVQAKKDEKKLIDGVKTFDVKNIKLSDFALIPRRRARSVHPFEGYALKPKIEVGRNERGHRVMRSATFIIGLSPHSVPQEDVSGRGITIIDSAKKKPDRIVNLGTYHSRVIPTGPNSNEDVVFDRRLKLADGNEIYFAIVESHSTRAQLAYYFHSKNQKIEVDNRYLILDQDQVGRLQRLFQQIINPKLRRERFAQAISGEIEASEEELQQLPTE